MLRILLCALTLAISAVAVADDAKIKQVIEERLQGAKVESIAKTPYSGLYEVQVGNELLYTDDQATYIFVGNVHDGQTLENLTEGRLRELNKVDFSQFPLDQAIKIVNGKGTRKLVYFSDPNCPYCKRMDKELTQVSDLTVYVFLFPILSPDSMAKSQKVWCSTDRAKAWQALMLEDKAPIADGNCDTPILKNLELGQKLRIRGTPALFFPNGERVSGAITGKEVDDLLTKAVAKAK